jgi:hypothetical protein
MMDKRTERIIDKCHILIENGYDLRYCLDRFKDYRKEIEEYFSTADKIGDLRKILPDKEFRESSLDPIIERAEKLQKSPEIKSNKNFIPARRKILKPAIIFMVFFLIAVFSISGTLFASQNSIPGETLYPVKISFENFRLNIYPENLRDELHLKFLNNRIEEANTLFDRNHGESRVLIEDLIIEIDRRYQLCRNRNYLDTSNCDALEGSIESIKRQYQKRFGQDPEKGTLQKEDGSDTQNKGSINGNKNNKGGSH